MRNKHTQISLGAFTFVELIIVVIILGILSTIGFVSFVDHISSTRDTKRKSDLTSVEIALSTQKQKRGYYPIPGDGFNIINSGEIVAQQGKLNKNVPLDGLDSLPLDPKTKGAYFYSTTLNRQEYQLASSLEAGGESKSLLTGNYKSVSKNTLPTIILAISSTIDIEINSGTVDGAINRNLFIFNNSQHNYPYDFDTSEPFSDGTTFSELLTEAESKDYWQNSDYTSCLEIFEAGKSISTTLVTQEYQILSGGSLVSTDCDMTSY